jgi:hypothetical protein
MNETLAGRGPRTSTGFAARRSVATSLFGGAILATVTTASLAQTTYFPTADALSSATGSGYVVLGGNLAEGDGGGGAFMQGASCTGGDGGIVFQDTIGNCFYRADPTYSVREWGAVCDVVDVDAAGAAIWTPDTASNTGTLTFPTTLVSTPLVVVSGGTPAPAPIFIAISQVGQPTLWPNSAGAALPAVSLTRFSTLGGTQVGYKRGDLVSFAGGTFSQQAAIIVDAVSSTGSITQWHFLWGGLYDPAHSLPTSTMAQDNTHTYCGLANTGSYVACGISGVATGAMLTPAWSGWSALNRQTISNVGTGYTIGQMVTLTSPGASARRYATIVVEGTTTMGGVSAFDWVDYGSFTSLVNTGTLSDMANSSGVTFNNVGWTQGPYASTIISAGTVGTSGMSQIIVDGAAAFPGTMAVQSFYYGHNDYNPINQAFTAMPANLARGATPASRLIIPAGCGTTQPLDILVDHSSNDDNPTLAGSNQASSGLYAFANPPESRGDLPVLSSVLYAGVLDTTTTGFDPAQGGGLQNLFVEGFGIPEGYGYWGLVQGSDTITGPGSIPQGYVGPRFAAPPAPPVRTNIPVAGTAVEIDNVVLMRIDNVHITDGGIGVGNATMEIGIHESDPTNALKLDVGTTVFTDSRIDSNPAFMAGPSSPDFALKMNSHDSVYRNLTLFDGTKADLLAPGGNIYGQIHVGSSAINATLAGGPAPSINWAAASIANFGFAGVADYGVYILGNASLQQTRCDIANIACAFISVDQIEGQANPGQITDTQIGCGAFNNVPAGYAGVQFTAGAVGAAVGGTAAAGQCAMVPGQLVTVLQGGALDTTTSLCNNSNAPIAGCTGYLGGYAANQSYTQPTTNYGTVSLSGNVLYAVPFYSPSGGGPVGHLSLYVTAPGSFATQCVLGIYSGFGGRPNALLSPGVTVPVSLGGPVTTSAGPVPLAPATLYFLAVGCNGTVTVEGVTNTSGALTIPLTGGQDFTSTTAEMMSSWTYSSSLPPTFGTPAITAGGPVPNVYAKP